MAKSNHQPMRPTTYLWLVITLLGVAGLLFLAPVSELDRRVIIRTLGLGLSASLIAIPIGGAIAWVCQSKGLVSRVLFLACAGLLLVPMFIHVSSWDAAFGKLGWLTATRGEALNPLVSGWNAAAWIHGIATAPYVALILLIGLSLGRRVYEEQALIDTSASGVFWNVTIWRLIPLLILNVVWIVVSCAREIAVTDLYQIGTLAEQIYLGYSLGLNSIQGNWSPDQLAEVGSQGPNLTVAIIGWLSIISLSLFMKLTSLDLNSNEFFSPNKPASSRGKTLAGMVILLVLVAIPVVNVVTRACFFVRPVDGVPTQGYSLGQLVRAVSRSITDYQNEFVWSFLISITSATIILFIAVLFASISRLSRLFQFIFVVLLAITCALPGPYIGTMVGELFTNLSGKTIDWLYNYTIAAPVIANVIFCWPVGAMLAWFLLRKTPQDAMENSSLEGASSLTSTLKIGLAGNWVAIAGITLITFAYCFGELSASQIVRPAGMDTVPRKMLGDLHAGVNELTAGITIVTSATIVAISLLGWAFIWLNHRNNVRK